MDTEIKLSKNKRRYPKSGIKLVRDTIRMPAGLDLIIERIVEKNKSSKSVVVCQLITVGLKALATWDIDTDDLNEIGGMIL
jgi:hypothetical protein